MELFYIEIQKMKKKKIHTKNDHMNIQYREVSNREIHYLPVCGSYQDISIYQRNHCLVRM